MSGLVLLDEDQQRSLYERQQQELAQNHTRIQSGFALDTQNFQRARPPPAREPRTDFTGLTRPPPRTDFTSGDQGLPRTDFTSRGQAATTSSTGKPSISTNSSSGTAIATGDLSAFGGGRFDNNERVDSYPILRDDDIRESSTGTPSDHNSAAQYAGTSSGLKISVRFIMAGVVIGLALGIVLSQLNASSLVAQWVSLPGDLFLRALKCLVVPYVFCSVAVAVGDIVFVGKVSVIGLQTAKIFFIFWLSTVVLGVAVALIFRPFFRVSSENAAIPANSIGFTCANNMLLSTQTNGSIACSTNSTIVGRDASFVVTDVNDVYKKNTDDVVAQLSISDQIMQMITPIVSGNIVESLADGELLSVITFSMVLGSIAGQNFFTKTRRTNYLYLVLLQLRNTFFLLMEWTIWLSPVAVISIIAGSFATNQEAFDVFSQVYPYLLAVIAAGLLQVLVLYPLIVFLLTRCNPYSHMKQMVRAYMFAFACSSSLATMPVTLSSIKKAKVCSQSVANFVISIGAVSNISGMGFYMPIALVFMAESSGNGDQLTVLRIVGIFVLSLLACSGTPPIPASGLVVISTAYTTLFGEIPSTFAYVVAFDFIADRISTTCNVNDDLMALKIISETTDETVAQDHLGERF